MFLLTKLFDRQIVNADKLHTFLDQELSGIQFEVSEILTKLHRVVVPEGGVSCSKQKARDIWLQLFSNESFVDGEESLRYCDHLCFTNERVKLECFHSCCTFDEVCRRIDMGSGVCTEFDVSYVGRVAICECKPIVDLNAGIARICRHLIRQRYGDVVKRHSF